MALGAPCFHDGSVATLNEAVRPMAGVGKPDPTKTPVLQPRCLSEAELDKVVAFLAGLTSTEPWQAPVLPRASTPPSALNKPLTASSRARSTLLALLNPGDGPVAAVVLGFDQVPHLIE